MVEVRCPEEALCLPHGVIRISSGDWNVLNIPTQRVTPHSIYLAARHLLRRTKKPIVPRSLPFGLHLHKSLTQADVLAMAIENGYCRYKKGKWRVYDVLTRVDQVDLDGRTLGIFPVDQTCAFLPRVIKVASRRKEWSV